MRLGTCIALELCCAAGLAAGLVVGATRGVTLAGDYFGAREAAAATTANESGESGEPRERTAILAPMPGAELRVPVAAAPTVYDAPDDVLLGPVAATPLANVKLNHGGTSLSLRLTFASGARAAFKPQQIHPQSDPRREIAAYRIDRLLGIGHVPPAKPGRFAIADLVAATEPSAREVTAQRLADEAIQMAGSGAGSAAPSGFVQGELSWWIPDIRDLTISDGAQTYRVDEKNGQNIWLGDLQHDATIPDAARPLVEQLAAVVLFDVLIDNADRWTGNNTKGSLDNRTLYFMDNTLAFSTFTLGHQTNLGPLQRMEVFPRALVERLRALTYATVAAALDVGDDPLGPLLTPAEIRALLARRDHLMRFVDDQIATFGEKAVLALP